MTVHRETVGIQMGGALAGLEPMSVEMGAGVNEGWDATVVVRGEANLTKAAPCTLGLRSRGFTRSTPPMVVMGATPTRDAQSSTLQTSIKLKDEAQWKMSRGDVNLPSFRNSTVSAILSAVTSEIGVTFVGSADWAVGAEDIKGQKGVGAVKRLAAAQGCFLDTTLQGWVRFVPVGQSVGGGGMVITNVSRTIDATKEYTSIICQKSSGIPGNVVLGPYTSSGHKVQALSTPIARGIAFDRSSSGYPSFVGFWQGDPGQPGSLLVDYTWFVDPGIITVGMGPGPITHISVDVVEPADGSGVVAVKVEIHVTPVVSLPAGCVPEFRIQLPASGPGLRPAEKPWEEQLWPNPEFVRAREPSILLALRMDSEPINVSGPLFLPIGLMETVPLPSGYPSSNFVKSWRHSVNASSSTAGTSAVLVTA